LSHINIPNSLSTIRKQAFAACTSLVSIKLSECLKCIEDYAFAESGITEIMLPGDLSCIGTGAFAQCDQLRRFKVDLGNQFYSSLDGVLFNKNQNALLAFPPARSGSYIIPHGVEIIADKAFARCDLIEEVAIPDSVTNIGMGAFAGCTRLSAITLLPGLSRIGAGAFGDCPSLTEITIPESVTNLGRAAFQDCRELKNVVIPNFTVPDGNLMKFAFEGCTNLKALSVY
jgi:hypothetical protein